MWQRHSFRNLTFCALWKGIVCHTRLTVYTKFTAATSLGYARHPNAHQRSSQSETTICCSCTTTHVSPLQHLPLSCRMGGIVAHRDREAHVPLMRQTGGALEVYWDLQDLEHLLDGQQMGSSGIKESHYGRLVVDIMRP